MAAKKLRRNLPRQPLYRRPVLDADVRNRTSAPGEERRVFDKFYRGEATGTRSGAGLGLAIARGIVEAHGGRILAEPRPGGGAVFRFFLPLAAEPPEVRTDDA